MESVLRFLRHLIKDFLPLLKGLAILAGIVVVAWIWQIIDNIYFAGKRYGKQAEERERNRLAKAAPFLLEACLAAESYIQEGEDVLSRDDILEKLAEAIKIGESKDWYFR